MKIKESETIPSSEVFVLENGEPIKKNIENILKNKKSVIFGLPGACLLYTSPSPRDLSTSRMPSSA